jgi:hypothetical protein
MSYPVGHDECTRCGGKGTIALPERGRKGMGTGRLFEIQCPSCCGKGGVRREFDATTLRPARSQHLPLKPVQSN